MDFGIVKKHEVSIQLRRSRISRLRLLVRVRRGVGERDEEVLLILGKGPK
jgi:hypothetical protein